MTSPQIRSYLAENASFIGETSAIALEQVPDTAWAAVIEATERLTGGGTDPGIDCDVVVTRETLADFDAARMQHWSERGARAELTFTGFAAVEYDRLQLRRGDPRTSMIVIDAGDVRVVLR